MDMNLRFICAFQGRGSVIERPGEKETENEKIPSFGLILKGHSCRVSQAKARSWELSRSPPRMAGVHILGPSFTAFARHIGRKLD